MKLMKSLKNSDTTFALAKLKAISECDTVTVMDGDNKPVMMFDSQGTFMEILAPTMKTSFLGLVAESYLELAALHHAGKTQLTRVIEAYNRLSRLHEYTEQFKKEGLLT